MPEFTNNQPLPPTNNQEWKLPLILAIAVHLLILLLLIMPPSFFSRHRHFQEIQTINLFTADELKPVRAKPRILKPRAKVQPPPKAPPPKKAKSIKIAEPPKPVAKPEKAVSLRPHKLKKKSPKPVKKETVEEKLLRKALERAKARVNAQKEDRKIKQELSNLVKNLHTVEAPAPEPTPPPSAATAQPAPEAAAGSATSSSATLDEAMRRYYMAISRRIHAHWSLPETQNWDASLEAVIVIVVRRDGIITRTFFEKKSANVFFDQYVEKTIQESAPMPVFPADIKKNRLEIGLKFRPSGMF